MTPANSRSGRPPDLPHVLIVEEDADTRDMYHALLTQSGFRVTVAASIPDGIALARALQPDVVTTGLGQPGAEFDGTGLTAQLKQVPETNAIRVIAVTGWTSTCDVDRALAAGYDAVLLKPCPPDELLAEIRRQLASKTSESQRPAKLRLVPGTRRTTSPPLSPPSLRCPHCDRLLVYHESILSGVASVDQWDHFGCRRCRIELEYRHRTRRMKILPRS